MGSIDTDEFRRLLEQERERLAKSIAFLHSENPGDMADETGELATANDNHLGDMAAVTFDRELDEGLEEGAQQTLDEIDAALARIEGGTYGRCEADGEQIPVERLRALPWATLCIDHERAADGG